MRIAANHLKSARKLASEQRGLDFDRAVARLDRAQSRGWFSHPLAAPQPLMEAEMRATCAQALLLCLDRGHRLAFILGVVMGLSGQDGAYILDITPQTFRKRLSRARERVANFLEHNCGLFDPDNRCHCGALAAGYLQKGWLDPGRPLFHRAGAGGPDQRDPEPLPARAGRFAAGVCLFPGIAPGRATAGLHRLGEVPAGRGQVLYFGSRKTRRQRRQDQALDRATAKGGADQTAVTCRKEMKPCQPIWERWPHEPGDSPIIRNRWKTPRPPLRLAEALPGLIMDSIQDVAEVVDRDHVVRWTNMEP